MRSIRLFPPFTGRSKSNVTISPKERANSPFKKFSSLAYRAPVCEVGLVILRSAGSLTPRDLVW